MTTHRNSPGRLLSIGEVCAEISRGRSTIYRWIKDGTFPRGRRYPNSPDRFWTEAELEEWKSNLITTDEAA